MTVLKLIINRGTINITNPSDVKSGVSALLPAGDHKILFADYNYVDYDDGSYALAMKAYNANGVRQGYILGTLEADGFNFNLSYDSHVHFITNK